MVDKKAIKILYDRCAASGPARQRNDPSSEDFQYAREAGVMFDDVLLDHDSSLSKCIDVCDRCKKKAVVDAFVSSLTSRRLDLRSALGSYACGQNLPMHSFDSGDGGCSTSCVVCSQYIDGELIDLSILNFERIKFGGVRHLNPTYIWLDLMIFSNEVIPKVTRDDIDIFRSVVDSLMSMQGTKISQAERELQGLLKSNKYERVNIISILGYCGILKVPDYDPLYKRYIPMEKRKYSSYVKSDWPFPADLWKPVYGLDEESLYYWFSEYLE